MPRLLEFAPLPRTRQTGNGKDLRHKELRHHEEGLRLVRFEWHQWCRTLGWQTLINSKGPTWRKLTAEQQAVTTQSQAVVLMMEHSSVIRRPVVENDTGQILVGFDPTMFDSFVR
jgi:arsenate reductase-like glutaredoxin family protein